MKVLLTGVKGQLGRTISLLKPNNLDLIEISRKELDLEDSQKCFELILSYKPDWVINAAAYTAVDLAEKQIEKAYRINAEAPRQFSRALSIYGGKLLHISTDFVFDGKKRTPYLPSDRTNPINSYGKSKVAGEEFILEALGNKNQSTIIRTSWLMSPFGNNFALKMLEFMKKNKIISVVNDQFGSPTSCESLAKTCWDLILKSQTKLNSLPEIIHWSNIGKASWYDVAKFIMNISLELKYPLITSKINKLNSEQYQTKAIRPKYTVLDSSYTEEILNIKNISWKDAIRDILTDPNLKRYYQ